MKPPYKLQKIDEFLLSQLPSLELSDHCYFLDEYVVGLKWDHSKMNGVIYNFKKDLDKKDTLEWLYKEKQIPIIASWLLNLTSWGILKNWTWVPIPPSKTKDDPKYDDRLLRVLSKMKESERTLDIQELLLTKNNREAAHYSKKRPTIKEHLENFIIDDSQKNPKPNSIIIFDDVITTGATFKAAQRKLQQAFPQIPIIGIFIARACKRIENIGFEDNQIVRKNTID